jgi:hypothetical protein
VGSQIAVTWPLRELGFGKATAGAPQVVIGTHEMSGPLDDFRTVSPRATRHGSVKTSVNQHLLINTC